ncbi:MAG: class I SAM-dependent methyltransferase [Candidatus Omnitrophica bacterium]|nr:class I SAM-dependent methyltransferase [Candidatus Omnitrophota bacterium]
MVKYKDVSITAFIVNESRARLESLSGDIYAKLWVTEEAKHLWEELAQEVYPYDHINLSLRNRFYLDRTKGFVTEHADSVFVNMAAGFTSYPHLFDTPCRCIETDYPHIMNFKEKKVREWQQEGALPERSIEFYPLDMENHDELNSFEESFASWCEGTPAIIIMEGLTYYLSTGTLDNLFSCYAKYLVKGSLVVFDFWGPDSDSYPAIQRLKKYLSRISGGPVKDLTYMDMDHIRNIKQFSVVEHTDIAELERRYTETLVLQEKANRFPTEFVVLNKN